MQKKRGGRGREGDKRDREGREKKNRYINVRGTEERIGRRERGMEEGTER